MCGNGKVSLGPISDKEEITGICQVNQRVITILLVVDDVIWTFDIRVLCLAVLSSLIVSKTTIAMIRRVTLKTVRDEAIADILG